MAKSNDEGFGKVLGILVFLGGVGLLLFTFKMAFDMFGVPPEEAIGLHRGETFDVNKAAPSLASILTRILLLIVMGLVGSFVANRGISLFTHSRSHHAKKDGPAIEG